MFKLTYKNRKNNVGKTPTKKQFVFFQIYQLYFTYKEICAVLI